MTTLKCNSTFGNFAFEATAEVNDETLKILASAGLLQVLQRSPATAAEKQMAGYEKRPDGFKRNDITYSPENAKVLATFLESAEVEVGRDAKGKAITESPAIAVTVTEYVPEETESKFSAERAKYVQRCGEGKGSTLAQTVGYDGPIGDGTKDGAPEAFLRAIRAWVKAQANKL